MIYITCQTYHVFKQQDPEQQLAKEPIIMTGDDNSKARDIIEHQKDGCFRLPIARWNMESPTEMKMDALVTDVIH